MRGVAVFVGSAVLGASVAARATPQCQPGPALELRVISIQVAGEERPSPVEGLGLYLFEGGDLDTNYQGNVYDPDTEASRLVELEPVAR